MAGIRGLPENCIIWSPWTTEEIEAEWKSISEAVYNLNDEKIDQWFEDFTVDADYAEVMVDSLKNCDPELSARFESRFTDYARRLITRVFALGGKNTTQQIYETVNSKCECYSHPEKFPPAHCQNSCQQGKGKWEGMVETIRKIFEKISPTEWDHEVAIEADDEMSCSDSDWSDEELPSSNFQKNFQQAKRRWEGLTEIIRRSLAKVNRNERKDEIDQIDQIENDDEMSFSDWSDEEEEDEEEDLSESKDSTMNSYSL